MRRAEIGNLWRLDGVASRLLKGTGDRTYHLLKNHLRLNRRQSLSTRLAKMVESKKSSQHVNGQPSVGRVATQVS
jgi:hypothetical protein